MKPDIIFIGAGPIGLLGAIQLKLSSPGTQILMYDKYSEPKRTHSMYVNKDVLQGMNRDNKFGELLDSISGKVQINDLENKLRQFAASIGIQIEIKEIMKFEELKSEYPDTKYFVGSGGLRGIVHQQVFHAENQLNEPLRFAAEVKYKAMGHPQQLSKLGELPGVHAQIAHLVSEYVGHEKDGLTPVALRIFVNEDTYEKMRAATFKNPYTLADVDKIDNELLSTIRIYLNARKNLAKEVIQEGSLKISMITLSMFATKHFCRRQDGITVVQLGEEALAFPFYRSFNDNATCVMPFVRMICALMHPNENLEEKDFSSTAAALSSFSKIQAKNPIEKYERTTQHLVDQEKRIVRVLDFGIDLVGGSVAMSRAVPSVPEAKLAVKRNGKRFLEEARQERAKEQIQAPSKFSCTIL